MIQKTLHPEGFLFYFRGMQQKEPTRLQSLDFLRGFIMVLLALESARLFDHLFELSEGHAIQAFFLQFFQSSLAWASVLGSDSALLYVHCRNSSGILAT